MIDRHYEKNSTRWGSVSERAAELVADVVGVEVVVAGPEPLDDLRSQWKPSGTRFQRA